MGEVAAGSAAALDPGRGRLRRFALLAGALLLAVAAGIGVGAVPVPVLRVALGGEALTELQGLVLWELRIPRVALAGTVGAALAVSGAALQGLFRNPLAEPQLIGVSSGAALGAVAMIVLGNELALAEGVRPFALPAAAFLGALAVTGLLYLFARRSGGSVATLLLVGIAVNALAATGIGAFTWLSDDGELRTLTFWTMGSFGAANWEKVLPALALMAAAMVVLARQARPLDRLQLGEVEARRLGVDVPRLRRTLVFGSAAAVGAGVAVSGIVGFVGLVVPHLVRLLGGAHHGWLLPGSALFGAALMILADLGARTLVVPAELPVGLITSAIGAPFFLWLIQRVRRT